MRDDYKEEIEEENVYSEGGRESNLDDDEISGSEEAFMRGYDDAEEYDDGDYSESEEE